MSIRILAMGAHPDDIELGLGGCLAKHVDMGDDVFCLIFSRGEKGVSNDKAKDSNVLGEKDENISNGKIREAETKKALNLIGVKEQNIKVLGLIDTGIEINEKVIEDVSKCIDKINPELIYTHHFEDDHLDHVNTSFISLHSARRVKTILFYESPSTRASFSPNYFEDISAYMQKKIEALKLHETQVGKNYMVEDLIKSKARFRGFQAGIQYAEGFTVQNMVGK